MRRCALLLLALAGLAGCGGGGAKTSTHTAPPLPLTGPSTARCREGVMGGCVPSRPGVQALPPTTSRALVPDVSEWNGSCRLYSEAVFRVYEAGTGRQDTKAACHAAELRRLKAWSAVYAFVRPPGYGAAGSCTQQADRTVAIVRALGGIVGPVIEDAEVPLPRGFVRCFLTRVAAAKQLVATYTSTGTASGGPFSRPLWLASYGAPPRCLEGICQRVAWQFSPEATCRGVRGDCSIDEGLLAIRAHAPPSKTALLARQRALRRALARYGCRARIRRHERLGPRCTRWKREGDEVGALLRA